MQSASTPVVKDLVLVGGGHSHLFVLKYFGMNPLPGVRITLITRDLHTPYSGMLPGYIAGHYSYDQSHIDLRPLANFAGARVYHDKVTALDLENNRVICPGRPPVHFDTLSINIGSRPGTLSTPGAKDFSIPVKPIDRFLTRWDMLVERVRQSNRPFHLLLVGGGAGGVEMALAAQVRLQQALRESNKNIENLSVSLITDSEQILATHNRGVQKRFERVVASRDIRVLTGHTVTAVWENEVICANGQRVEGDAILLATSASAPAWPGQSGLAVDEQGFILVNDFLQSSSHPCVFAAGDVTASINHPRPKSGVFAVRQGEPLARNIARYLRSRSLKPFKPQNKFLSLISTGDRYAIASRGSWSSQGKLEWRFKDRIDRQFMQKFSELPKMASAPAIMPEPELATRKIMNEITTATMRCGGCGAKVGSELLARVLNRLQVIEHRDIVVGMGSGDDAAVFDLPPGKSLVQSVDYFRSFIDDPYTFGQIAAHHALSDLFAMGATVHSALAIATLPYGLESDTEEQLFQLMSGAVKVLNDSQAVLAGGHSSEGAELSFGLSVTGLVDPEHLLRNAGLSPGDAIILTKPLGTGTLFAADMRRQAKGRWIEAAIGHMLNSNQAVSQCLLRHGATAATDVTGFGLIGHLLAMTKASQVDASIEINHLPIMEGVAQTIEKKLFSSLYPQNLRLASAIRNPDIARKHPLFPILFDPQTAGGLLAGIPAESAQPCLRELNELGFPDAAIIGKVMQKSGQYEAVDIM